MYSWQIQALKLEESALDSLTGFIHEHALYFLIGVIWLLITLLAWVLSGGLRRNLLKGKTIPHVQAGVVIHFPVGRPTPPPEPVAPRSREPISYDDDE